MVDIYSSKMFEYFFFVRFYRLQSHLEDIRTKEEKLIFSREPELNVMFSCFS